MPKSISSKSKKILIVGQVPPPFHGQAMMVKILVESEMIGVDKCFIPANFSKSLDEVGVFKFKKIWHLTSAIFSTVKFLLTNRNTTLVYYPAPPKIIPLIRDVLFLVAVRPFAKRTVFIYQAAGSGEFLRKCNPVFRQLAACAYQHADAAVQVSKSAPRDAASFRPKREVIVSNGISVPISSKTKKRSGVNFQLLFVGIHSREKGVLCCLEVVRILIESGVAVEIQFVGEWIDQTFKNACINFVTRHQLTAYVKFLGRQLGPEKWDRFSAADLLIFPSCHFAESFGLVAVEAFAYGLPVVACKWRGLVDIIDENTNGYLIDGQNPDDFAVRIRSLINDRKMYDQFSHAARRKYLENFTEEIHLENMKKLLIEVTNSES